MNQGRIWTVVSPTVGLPLFLGSVALTSLLVHAEILSHTTWFSGYWDGADKVKTSMVVPAPSAAPAVYKSGEGFTLSVAPAPASTNTPASFVITVTPNAAASAATPAVLHTSAAGMDKA